jgi:two-component system invasion response regulator UvrY
MLHAPRQYPKRVKKQDADEFVVCIFQEVIMRVLIVDDHPVVRRGLAGIIQDEIKSAIVCEAGEAIVALALVKAQNFDVVTLDLNLPGRNGFDLMKDLWAARPGLRFLILSVNSEQQYALRAIKSGAYGYLCKDSVTQELVTAIRRIAQGHKYLTETLAEALAFEFVRPDHDKPPHELLSNREYETLLLIASGKTVSEIATELSLSVKTVSTYRVRILEKMKMRTNAELTRYAFEYGLLHMLRGAEE